MELVQVWADQMELVQTKAETDVNKTFGQRMPGDRVRSGGLSQNGDAFPGH